MTVREEGTEDRPVRGDREETERRPQELMGRDRGRRKKQGDERKYGIR